MKYFYKKLDDSGTVVLLLSYEFRPHITDSLIVEITEEEYNTLLAKIVAANQEEIDTDEISDEEALNIILGVSE